MPWRATDDPYRIWVSEVMLQQTRVDQAQPYYERFVDAFPTVDCLAEAELDEVLLKWEGLGYYSRARNLHAASQMVVREHDSRVPDTYDAIRELPGIGPYTAAAVLSIAYGRPHAVLDGNVTRVLTRVFAVEDEVQRAPVRRRLQQLADDLLEPAEPGRFNEAVMELGATVCTPANPRCSRCPLAEVCRARAAGTQAQYPVKKRKAPVPHHDVAVGLVFDDDERLLIQRRPEDAMLGGLWEFPGGKVEEDEAPAEACVRELKEELGIRVVVQSPFGTIDHAYSHFKVTLHAFRCSLAEGVPKGQQGQPVQWIGLDELNDYAFPRANRRLIEALEERQTHPTLFD